MPRIVAGALGGRRLTAPAGAATRPTADRVREALFSTLGDLRGRRFLDGYAGSGAVGLEALSRGAAHVLLVERDRAALAALRANVAALGLRPSVHSGDILRLLAAAPDRPYDVVFLDPPYADTVDAAVDALDRRGWVAPEGSLVVERSTRTPDPVWPARWTARARRYGETTLWYVRAP